MPGGHIGGSQLIGQGHQGGKLHCPVAPGAGQGGAPGQIVGVKRATHLLLQLLGDIPDVEGQAQLLRRLSGRLRSPQADVQIEGVDLISLLPQPQGRHRRVHPAGQPQHYLLTVRSAHLGPPAFPSVLI